MTSTIDPLCPPVSGSQPVPDVAGTVSRPTPRVDFEHLPRELGRVVGELPGPTLICLGGLHGNEPAGVLALQEVVESLRSAGGRIAGELIALVGNRQALAEGRRFIDHDLNRAWHRERLGRLLKSTGHGQAEDREQLELDATLQRIIDEAPGRVFLLDLHTTSGPGSAFAILDDTLPNREMALDFPVPLVLGLEEELGGTLASYLTAQGVTVLGFEAGQHDDPGSVDRAAAAVWVALDSCGLLAGNSRRRAFEARTLLAEQTASDVGIVEVLYRYNIDSANGFCMEPGFESFQPVAAGQVLARNGNATVRAPHDGMLLMPLYQDQGEDGFFLTRQIRPFWLPVSAALRSWRLERFLHRLPGVSRHPDRADTFLVSRRLRRFAAPHLFHLLGFRREGEDEHVMVMARRHDLEV
jgi:predicted deacylase